ncbi:protein of unknown function [Vibrio tapetis subsp. tapetis]|uniref:Uncharacterized protein n=1 Tax=Vibrio tapetis subsp. tapetis TaxID=1671868 RepID=A0A2N8ZEP6_9VIBR|nr:protein of unknown function [Vibrio tapetis subsp. tapetis]
MYEQFRHICVLMRGLQGTGINCARPTPNGYAMRSLINS